MKTTTKSQSIESPGCASSEKYSLFCPTWNSRKKADWIKRHELWVAFLQDDLKRIVTPVVVGSSLRWMDCITGGFYFNLVNVLRHPLRAEEILLSIGKGVEEC